MNTLPSSVSGKNARKISAVQFQNKRQSYDGGMSSPLPVAEPYRKIFTPEEAVKNTFWLARGFDVVWNKLYRKCILDGILFPIGKIYEDVYWTHKIMEKAFKVVTLDTAFYHYIKRSDSITRNPTHFISTDYIDAWKERLEFSRRNFPSLELWTMRVFCDTCYRLYIELNATRQRFDTDGALRRDLLQRFCKELRWKVISGYPLKKKVRFLLFRYCPELLVRLLPLYTAWRHFLKS